MTELNLNAYSLVELKQLKKDVEKALSSLEERRRKQALAAAESAVKEMGFSLSELTGKKQPRAINAPKFRHPEHPEQTWSGRGRRPAWFVEALENGASQDDLLI